MGDDAVQEKVVPLDGGADQRRGDDFAHRGFVLLGHV
jgi:hypothetical protein